jgi:hypothetical protein
VYSTIVEYCNVFVGGLEQKLALLETSKASFDEGFTA